jgi:hypothetical protein
MDRIRDAMRAMPRTSQLICAVIVTMDRFSGSIGADASHTTDLIPQLLSFGSCQGLDRGRTLLGMTRFRSIGTLFVTLFIFAIVGGWLLLTGFKIGISPSFNAKGAVTIDQYARAKDVLQIVFPLATAAVGFWFGNQGTVQAQNQADKATQNAQDAHTQARRSQAKVEAILGASNDADLINKAKAAAPGAFPEMEAAPSDATAVNTGAPGAEPPAPGAP